MSVPALAPQYHHAPLLALDAGPFLVGPCHDVLNTAAHDAILGPQVHGAQAVEVTGAVLSEINAGIDLFHASATNDMTQMLPEVDAVGMLSDAPPPRCEIEIAVGRAGQPWMGGEYHPNVPELDVNRQRRTVAPSAM